MGLVDRTEVFCEALEVQDTQVTESIDLGAAPTTRAMMVAGQYLIIETVDPATDGSAETNTVTFSLESDSVTDLSASPTVHWKSEPLVVTDLVVGRRVASLPLPTVANYERHIGIRFSVNDAAGDPSTNLTGSYTAYLSPDPMLKTNYPNAI